MKNIKLLDCTLRDGGYVNDWEFGQDNIVSIFERTVQSGVDIIEVGFLDDRRDFDINRSIMPDTDSVGKIYGDLDRRESLVVAMIDYGTCDIKNVKPCNESYLDGIRVIFKKHLREPALAFCKQLSDMGYKVFANLVSVTAYDDEEMLDLIRLANEANLYAVSIVDTYGLMHQENIQHYFDLLDSKLDKNISLAYHGHNNFQMGYANCISVLSNETERELIVDGSLYGMGKSAGNAPIELIAMHLNDTYRKSYNIGQLLEAVDANVMQFYTPATWGYNMFFYIAALNKCHPNYVKYLMNKRTLSVKSINEILQRLEGETKLLYNKDCIEEIYIEYQDHDINDKAAITALEKRLEGRKVMLIGPGNNVVEELDRIKKTIKKDNPITICINNIPKNIKPDICFISNAKRYVQLASRLAKDNYEIIATSNVTPMTSRSFDYVLNYKSLIDLSTDIIDNSLVMMLKVLERVERKEVLLAGFDGYKEDKCNYYNLEMEYDFVKNKARYLNKYTSEKIHEARKKMSIEFVTKSVYQEAIVE